MKITILHSIIGVAGAVIVGLVVAGNVVGQTAAPPAGLPPVEAAPPLNALPPPTPVPPAPSPARGVNPPTPAVAPASPVARPGAGIPPATAPVSPSPGASPAPDPASGYPGSEVPAGGAEGELQIREWKVSPDIFDDGHGGSTNAKEYLQKNGVTFGKGALAIFSPASSTLVVKNTPEQLKRIGEVIPRSNSGAAVGAPSLMPRWTGVMGGGRSPGQPGPKTARAPGASNYGLLGAPSTPPKASTGMGSASVSGLDPKYAVSNEFPVTSIEVARAHLAGELNQDPQASASRYAAIVANFDSQRQAAATAIYGLGEAYRKMGRTAEARVQYARILREFVDFPELAKQSQRQLGTTSGSGDSDLGGTISTGGRTDNVDEERALLREELELLEKELTRTQERIKSGVEPTSSGLQLQRDILRLKQQLARLPREIKEVPRRTVEPHEVPVEDARPKSVEEQSQGPHGERTPPKVEERRQR